MLCKRRRPKKSGTVRPIRAPQRGCALRRYCQSDDATTQDVEHRDKIQKPVPWNVRDIGDASRSQIVVNFQRDVP